MEEPTARFGDCWNTPNGSRIVSLYEDLRNVCQWYEGLIPPLRLLFLTDAIIALLLCCSSTYYRYVVIAFLPYSC